MAVVRFEAISQKFGDFFALNDVNASFESAKIHAVLGENGAGKSTLMKVLFGLQKPTTGRIDVDGVERKWRSPADAIAAGLGMVQQHFTLVPTLSVIDNIMLGAESLSSFGRLDRSAAISSLEKKLPSESLRLDWHKLVSELSVGEQQRVEILKLIARDAKIMVLDEPTAVLTPSEIEELFHILQRLRDSGRTIFVITHKLSEVFSFCDTWLALRAGRVGGTGLIEGTSLNQVVRAMVGSDVPPLRERAVRKPGEVFLKVRDVRTNELQGMSLRGFNIEVRAGEVVGIAGVDGSGQSELVDCILGLTRFSGEVSVGGRSVRFGETREVRDTGVALISEDRHHQSLWLDESVELNAGLGFETSFANRGWLNVAAWSKSVTGWLASFDVRIPTMQTPVAKLSGGNQQKLIFARELSGRETSLIICHQPTRGVDLAAIHSIHSELIERRDQGAAVLLISSELDELLALSDRIVAISDGVATGEFDRLGGTMNREAIGRAMTCGATT